MSICGRCGLAIKGEERVDAFGGEHLYPEDCILALDVELGATSAERDALKERVGKLDAALRAIAFWLPVIRWELGDKRYVDVEEVFEMKRIAGNCREALAESVPAKGDETTAV